MLTSTGKSLHELLIFKTLLNANNLGHVTTV